MWFRYFGSFRAWKNKYCMVFKCQGSFLGGCFMQEAWFYKVPSSLVFLLPNYIFPEFHQFPVWLQPWWQLLLICKTRLRGLLAQMTRREEGGREWGVVEDSKRRLTNNQWPENHQPVYNLDLTKKKVLKWWIVYNVISKEKVLCTFG